MDLPNPFGLRTEPGYYGLFTRNQAPGALPNGSRVAKIRKDQVGGDVLPIGAQATVLGSIRMPLEVIAQTGSPFIYFVEWDENPGIACGVSSIKIGPLQ